MHFSTVFYVDFLVRFPDPHTSKVSLANDRRAPAFVSRLKIIHESSRGSFRAPPSRENFERSFRQRGLKFIRESLVLYLQSVRTTEYNPLRGRKGPKVQGKLPRLDASIIQYDERVCAHSEIFSAIYFIVKNIPIEISLKIKIFFANDNTPDARGQGLLQTLIPSFPKMLIDILFHVPLNNEKIK